MNENVNSKNQMQVLPFVVTTLQDVENTFTDSVEGKRDFLRQVNQTIDRLKKKIKEKIEGLQVHK